MAILGFELEEIARLIALVESQGLEALVIEEEGRRLRIRGRRKPRESAGAEPAPQKAALSPRMPSRAIASSEPTKLPEIPPDHIALVSPMVGIFYRAEKPGAPPLIHAGDRIEVGQTVGIIEAMKVFSEFKAERAGVVVAVPAADGQLVQAGAPLIILKPDEQGDSIRTDLDS